MKLCTYERRGARGRPRLGALVPGRGGDIVDLMELAARGPRMPEPGAPGVSSAAGDAEPFFRSMQTFLEGGHAARRRARILLDRVCHEPDGDFEIIPAAEARLLAPHPRPRSMRDAMAFERHFLQARRGGARMLYPSLAALDSMTRRLGVSLIRVPALFRELPVYYKGNPASVVGPGACVQWPAYSDVLDYELEIGLFIHRRGRDLSPDEALEVVGGYTIFNDFSARDAQLREMKLGLGPAKGKDFDSGNAIGPYLVTPDEVGDPASLRAQARVNGEVWTRSDTSAMHFSVGEILSYISRSETLWPGDFIGLGTVPDGCGLEHGRWLSPGDEIELEVEKLGVLRNRIVKAST